MSCILSVSKPVVRTIYLYRYYLNLDYYPIQNDRTMKRINIHTPLLLFLDDSSRHKTICRYLMNQGICSIAELCQSEEETLRTLGGINNRDIAIVKSSLACYGLHLDMGRSELEAYMQGMPDIKLPETVFHASVSSEEWEQRRYETAKEIYLAFMPDILTKGISAEQAAGASVLFAECLITELRTEK